MTFFLSLLMLLFVPFFQGETRGGMRAEQWLRFPVSRSGYGEGGQFEADLSYEPAVPVTLTFGYDDEYVLVPSTISSLLHRSSETPDEIRLRRINPGEYRFESGKVGESGTVVLQLTFGDEIAHGWESIEYVLGGSSETFLLVPEGSPDPRETDVQRCNGGARIRLMIGEQAVTGMASGDFWLFDGVEEGSSSLVTNAGIVDVVAGPLCVGMVPWWQVRLIDDLESVAWTPEIFVDGGSYIMHPRSGRSDAIQPQPQCGSAPVSRLSVGAFAAAAADAEPQFLRNIPDLLRADLIGIIRALSAYRIVDGPVCEGGVLWWLIEYDGDAGWVAEGTGDAYWLEPARHVIFSAHLRDMSQRG